MISIIRIFFISLLLVMTGCRKNEFTLDFLLPEDVTANYKVAYYASDSRGGMTVESVAAVVNGKAAITEKTIRPAVVFISWGGSHTMVVYAEKGEKIKITGEGVNPCSWAADGNDINKEWSLWRVENGAELEKGDPQITNRLIADYVTQHPESPVSALMLLTGFYRKDDETLYRKLWLELKGEARDPHWAEMVGRADQPDHHVFTPGQLRSMTIRSLHNGVDTIRTDSAAASMLFFWYAGYPERKEHIDSIKALAEEFPDSAKRIIADICLEADSISWRSAIRTDSLKDVVRGWAPAGLADSRIITLGVKRAPFYIVFAPDGNQRYRGNDTGKALSEFRLLMEAKADSTDSAAKKKVKKKK